MTGHICLRNYFSLVKIWNNLHNCFLLMMYLALDLRRKKESQKPLKGAAIPPLFIILFINILQEGESETLGAETVQRAELQTFAGI